VVYRRIGCLLCCEGRRRAKTVPLTLIAGVGHWMIGTIDWQIFGSLLAGCHAPIRVRLRKPRSR
ncbi:MAG: hypothetical protein WBO12_17455, partial [Xanthobacteraceae bacterium]